MVSGKSRFARARVLALLAGSVALTLAAACASVPANPRAPAPGTGTLWGCARLVPRSGVEPAGMNSGAYADDRYRDAEPVDYDRVDFAVVFLEVEKGEALAATPREATELRIEESRFGLRFLPPRAATARGSEIVVRNATRSPKILSSPEARVVRRLAPGESTALAARDPGPIELRVLDDRDAAATVFVSPGPFSVASRDGRFEIRDLPPGRHRISAWHPRFPCESIEVDLGANESKRVDLRMSVDMMEGVAR